MQHIWVFFLEDRLPRVLGDRRQLAAQGVMPHLPTGARENRVRARDGAELELGIGRELLRFENLMRRLLLLGVVLPLYIAGGDKRPKSAYTFVNEYGREQDTGY